MKIKTLTILISVLIFSGFIFSFIYWFQFVRPKVTSAPEPIRISDFCVEFVKTPGEISCEEAINLSQKKYLGKIEYVNRVIVPEEEILWEVGINLDEPIRIESLPQEMERIKIIINAKTSEIISVRPGREI